MNSFTSKRFAIRVQGLFTKRIVTGHAHEVMSLTDVDISEGQVGPSASWATSERAAGV